MAWRTTVEMGKAVVALSLDASDVTGIESPDSGWTLTFASLYWDGARPVRVGASTSKVGFGMIATPRAELALGQLQLFWKTGNSRTERYDPENSRPRQVVLEISDQWDAHRDGWRNTYRIAGQRDPERRVDSAWGRELVVDLRRLRPAWEGGRTYDPSGFRNPPPRSAPHIPTGGGGPNSN